METLELSKEINSISGNVIKTLSFDFDALTPMDYKQAIKLEYKLKGEATTVIDVNSWSKSTSSEFRIATAWLAAIKGTQGLILDDIDKISFKDMLKLEQISIFFIADLG
mgnify:CR=1 FL=1